MGNRIETGKENTMLSTLAVLLTALWIIGIATANTMMGLIHVLLAFALAILLLRYVFKYKVSGK
jgi:hypothetical protein